MSDVIDARPLVDALLAHGVDAGASDLHLEPVAGGYEARMRVDGLLQTVATHATDTGRAMVSRLMVLAQLLTYRLDIPQEGRIAWQASAADGPLDLRLAVIPTAHGLRAAVRLPAELRQPRTLEALDLPGAVVGGLQQFAASDSGMLILCGPAGSGKTTTIYALLEYIAAATPGISIIALEDPVERRLRGVTQIEVSPFGELTYERALRSILRQDPQVLMLGEIRDAATASLAVQAALSGHRLICTLHAAHPGMALARLIEMGLEPYQLTSAIFAIVAQRLVRKLAAPASGAVRYAGRLPVAEFVALDAAARAAILARADAKTLRNLFAAQAGYVSMYDVAAGLVAGGRTDAAEILRVLGPRE